MAVVFRDISKSYQGTAVLSHFSLTLEDGSICCLMGPSGIGKTTALRILMGLETPDEGSVEGAEAISAVFQENRLFGFADAVKNIRCAVPGERLLFAPEEVLDGLLEREAWHRPVSELSGGMQRRVAVARALAVRSELLVMDEPFTGLDDSAREQAIRTILRFCAGRTLLVVTHREEDAALLGAKIIEM